jgi:hypothetical protein
MTDSPRPDRNRVAPPLIDVRPQHKIPLGKAFALCLRGIQHRLFRSILTLTVIVLAVAFFMSLLSESAFTRAVGAGIATENRERRTHSQRLAVYFAEPDASGMAARLALARAYPEDLAEIARGSGVAADRVLALAEDSEREARVIAFFENMDAGSRAILVRKTKPGETIAYLAAPSHWNTYEEGLRQIHALKPPVTPAEMKAIVVRHKGYTTEIEALAAAWRKAVAALKQDLSALGIADLSQLRETLADGEPTKMSALQRALSARGLRDTPKLLLRVHEQLAARRDRALVQEQLMTDEARTAWHKAYLEDPLIDVKMASLDDDRVVGILGGRWSRAELARISRELGREERLASVEQAVNERLPQGAALGSVISGRQAFLMAISFIVCMVGISNAMLMAITERFREIATMKCLGATDGFILQQFLMEAGFQGLIGGAAGMLIGAILSTIKCSVLFGGQLFAHFPALGTLGAGLTCIVTGMLLSTLASIYPSWMASRMAPMDAMRVE